jgi:ribonuclease HI
VVAIDNLKKLIWEYGGAAQNVTNNQMELAACIFAFKLILKSSENSDEKIYELRLDSKYVIQGVTEWSKNWVKNNWKNSQKKPVLNKEQWQEILELGKKLEHKRIKIKWTHVYGHTGEIWNERVDEIAKAVAAGEKIELRKGESYR